MSDSATNGGGQTGGGQTSEQVSFAKDILPQFSRWKAQMQWRFDLTDYCAVRDNALAIYERISSPDSPMPPPQFPRFDKSFTDRFKYWMDNEFAP